MTVEVLGPLALVGFIFVGLYALNRWTWAFSELLWHLSLAPKTVFVSVAVGTLVVALPLGLTTILPAMGPFSMLIQIIIVPFLAVPLANGIAFVLAHFRNSRIESIGWSRYIYESTRARQRQAYNSNRGQK